MYIIYAGICILAFIFVRYAMVETRGKTLEEMSRLFGIEETLAIRSGVDPASIYHSQNKEAALGQVQELEDEKRRV